MNFFPSKIQWCFAAYCLLGCIYPSAIAANRSAPPDAALVQNQTLYDFGEETAHTAFDLQDAKAERIKSDSGFVLRVITGKEAPWPGITLKSPAGAWDLTPYAFVSVSLKNTATNPVTVYCRVDNPGADGSRNCRIESTTLDPGKSGIIQVELKRATSDTLDGKLFGMRGYPVKPGGPGTLDPRRINQVVIYVNHPSASQAFEIGLLQAVGAFVPPLATTQDADPFFPFIDAFGQYHHKDWPGKIHSEKELNASREKEAKQLAEDPGPQGWDKYGGWAAGPKLNATGFFRTEKHQGKWWLVDPDGHLFFSHGLDCVMMLDVTPIGEREEWFVDFPGGQPELSEFVIAKAFALKGHYAGKTPRCFSFAGANFKRKYGARWKKEGGAMIHPRLRSWGLNTIGMWSDASVFLMRKTPYVDSIGSHATRMIEASEGYWGKFPDVFDPGFKEGLLNAMAGKAGGSARDPWCLGYFADNEMSWGDELSLGLAALRCGPDQPAKRFFVESLKTKYGEIQKLNAAWETPYESWDALRQNRGGPDKQKARSDLETFYTQLAEQYFRTVREAIKQYAPHQLYLGCRFAWVNSRAAAAAAKYCDVVSYNLYQRSVASFQFNGHADVPLIIGEFHFGALDRGMFHTGLVPTASQPARAEAYANYVTDVLKHPSFVGCHWFQYQDEPSTGRVYDEENYQIGFVDIADTPYAETIAASRAIADHLYALRLK